MYCLGDSKLNNFITKNVIKCRIIHSWGEGTLIIHNFGDYACHHLAQMFSPDKGLKGKKTSVLPSCKKCPIKKNYLINIGT